MTGTSLNHPTPSPRPHGVTRISHNFSAGVTKENESQEQWRDSHLQRLQAKSAVEYMNMGPSVAPIQYRALMEFLPPRARVLDIGVGHGNSSFCLALAGMETYAVEPNGLFCEIIASMADKFELNLRVIQGVGEDISLMDACEFDAVFFNSSLHHCDNPHKALANAYRKLKPGGLILLANENFLRPWKSKQWYYRMLEIDPVAMGHYGGNEHVYYNWEYSHMLRAAGFEDVRLLPPVVQDPLEKTEYLLSKRIGAKRVHTTVRSIVLRALYYAVEAKIFSNRMVFSTLAAASVVPCHFMARRQHA